MSTGNSYTNNKGAAESLLALPAGVELGQYRILSTLGQGGFGITYLAEVISTGEQVVIKENLPSFCALRDRSTLQVSAINPNDESLEHHRYLKRFVDEARLLAQLNHPNIVKVLGAFEALGTAYYVMPWVGGKELQKAAPAPDAISESWLLPILRTMLSTLEYLHGNNIYHRDVKPANILLTEDGEPVLIDFGTARAIISERSATHIGSAGYSPIEQITARGKRGPWTDVYSLGATCYRLITGERPPEATERLAEDDDPLRPLAVRAELYGRFSSVFLASIDKALALRSKDRWQSTAEWLAVLPDSAPTSASTSRSSSGISTTPISVASHPVTLRWRKAAIILLILVMALGIPGGYMLYRYAQTTAEQRLLDRLEAERAAREKAEAERRAEEEAERAAREKSEAEREAREKAEAERRADENARRRQNTNESAANSPNAMLRWLDFHRQTSSRNELSHMFDSYEMQVTNLKTGRVDNLNDIVQQHYTYIERWPNRQYDIIDYRITDNIIEIRSAYTCTNTQGKTVRGYCKSTYRISERGRIDGFSDDSSSKVLPEFGIPSQPTGGSKQSSAADLSPSEVRWQVVRHRDTAPLNDLSYMRVDYEPVLFNIDSGETVELDNHINEQQKYVSRWVKRRFEVVDYAYRGRRIEIRYLYSCSNAKGKTVRGFCKSTLVISRNGRIEAFEDQSSTQSMPAFSRSVDSPHSL